MIPDSLVPSVRFVTTLLAVFLCVTIANTSITMVQNAQVLKGSIPERTISLTGTGTVEATPTKASLTVSIFEQGDEQPVVQEAGNTTMKAVQTAIKALGVDVKDMQTSAYQLNPQYDYTDNLTKITGYQLTQSLEVTVRDVDQVSDIIDAATEAGANMVSSPIFEIENEDALKDEARAEAAKALNMQRASYEETLGIALGELVTIEESTGGDYPRPMYGMANLEKAIDSTATPIETGSTTVQVTLTATYALE